MTGKLINILAIESSCDDTSAAVIQNDKILANIVAGQKIHEEFGGVVPEFASRAHQQHIIPVVDAALKKSGINKNELHAIAYTVGPGLLGSLIVGSSFAKSFAQGLNIPLIAVNHMKGHVLAHFIHDDNKSKPKFPFICLTVSGGHTQLVLVKDYLDLEVVGTTIDDAAGEAFDKGAKILGLPYPGGPLIDKYAQKGNPNRFEFSVANLPELNFSFSGLKTSFLYFLQKAIKDNPSFIEDNMEDICASYQKTIISILKKKLIKAAKKYDVKDIAIAGGVSANSGLRKALIEVGQEHQWNTFIPDFQYCTDNAGMIAITAYYQYLKGDFSTLETVPQARMKIES